MVEHPSASPSSLNCCLHMLLWRNLSSIRNQINRMHIYIYRPILIQHAKSSSSKSHDWNMDEYDIHNISWLWDPKNHCGDNLVPSLKFPAKLQRGLLSSSWSLLVPCTDGLSYDECLLLTCIMISPASLCYYHRSQISQQLEYTFIPAGSFWHTWDSLSGISNHFAQHHGCLEAFGIS
jgi:hypothetical protein